VVTRVTAQRRRAPRRPETTRAHPARPVAQRPHDELSRAAPDIADGDALRRVLKRRHRAVPGEGSFLLSAPDADREAGPAQERVRELLAVRALPAGRGDDDLDALAAELPR